MGLHQESSFWQQQFQSFQEDNSYKQDLDTLPLEIHIHYSPGLSPSITIPIFPHCSNTLQKHQGMDNHHSGLSKSTQPKHILSDNTTPTSISSYSHNYGFSLNIATISNIGKFLSMTHYGGQVSGWPNNLCSSSMVDPSLLSHFIWSPVCRKLANLISSLLASTSFNIRAQSRINIKLPLCHATTNSKALLAQLSNHLPLIQTLPQSTPLLEPNHPLVKYFNPSPNFTISTTSRPYLSYPILWPSKQFQNWPAIWPYTSTTMHSTTPAQVKIHTTTWLFLSNNQHTNQTSQRPHHHLTLIKYVTWFFWRFCASLKMALWLNHWD